MSATFHVSDLLTSVHARREAHRAAQDMVRDRFAPDFTPFQFIDGRETQLSKILAWLLDSAGTHGQGSHFLGAFLRWLEPPWGDLGTTEVRVETEFVIAAGRKIDILLQAQGWTLAVENKPDAEDQPDQVDGYLAHLDRQGGPRALLYLSGDGSPPSERSISVAAQAARQSRGELLVKGYPELLPWLETCKGLCRADRVAVFLDEFIRYTRKRFEGVRDMSDRRPIVDAATGSPKDVGAAMEVIFAARDIRRRLLTSLADQVRQACAASHPEWRVTSNIEDSKWPALLIDYPDVARHQFGLVFETPTGRLNACYWGLRSKSEDAVADVILHAKIAQALSGGAAPTKRWPWSKWADARSEIGAEVDWETSSRPWTMIASGELAQRVVEAGERLHLALAAGGLTAPS
jgi:hypothetical protein